jgi:phosphatidylserine/phosphatidylglycerophosphate/cardiolipin synthase-like enzyme
VAEILEVARERWRAATGEEIGPVNAASDPWPDIMPVHVENARVALSTTAPPEGDKKTVREIEALYLDMIKAARSHLYIENQYFTSDVIGEALKASLAQPQGPQITVVTRLLSHGWLEEVTMSTLRTKLVRDLREADRYGRFRCLYPDLPGLCDGECLDVHSKVMIVDDEWCRVGSSNLSNRSMGMDTECDLTIEALGDAKVAAAIRKFRDELIAEHSSAPRALLAYSFVDQHVGVDRRADGEHQAGDAGQGQRGHRAEQRHDAEDHQQVEDQRGAGVDPEAAVSDEHEQHQRA